VRILIVRTSALGDVVHSLPLLAALRRHLPEARIGWVAESSVAPLLHGHPQIDDLLEVRLKTWRKRPLARETLSQLKDFLGAVRRFAPEVVLDLMGNHKSGVLSALTLCDRRIGAGRKDRREPSSAIWISEPVALEGEHVIDRTLSLLSALDLPRESADLGGDQLFPDNPAPADLPARFFVVHPGAAWPNKRYPPELWGQAAAAIRDRTGLDGLVVAGPAEGDLAEAARRSSSDSLRRFETADIAGLSGVLRQAQLVLAGDTGPLHLAAAHGTPVLALMGPTNPRTHGPYGQDEAALWHPLPCSFCHQRLDGSKPCLTSIDPETVAERAVALLDV
jgi:lipopolysaccharide heptosyltransferase I